MSSDHWLASAVFVTGSDSLDPDSLDLSSILIAHNIEYAANMSKPTV